MPLLTFNPSIAPTPGTRITPKISLHEADFGDGYSQVSPAGLNHIKQIISLNWQGLTEAQFNEISDFMFGQGGYIPFYYQMRGHVTPLKWICKEWSGSDSSPWRFEAKLEQSFTLDI